MYHEWSRAEQQLNTNMQETATTPPEETQVSTETSFGVGEDPN